MADELEELRAEAIDRGITFDGRWGVERLREALDNADPDQADVPEPAPKERPSGVRAGGHVLRDGRWVVENK